MNEMVDPQHPMRTREGSRLWRRLLNDFTSEPWTLLRCAKLPGIAALFCLVVSDVLTDSIAELQWLWWVPRYMLATSALLWIVSVFAWAKWVSQDKTEALRSAIWSGIAALLVLTSFSRVWGLPRGRPADSLRVIHWNASQLQADFAPEAVRQLQELDPDIFLFTDTSPGLAQACHRAFVPAGYRVESAGKFIAFSRVPIGEARALVASRDRYVSRFQFETPRGDLVVEPIDLPSRTTLPRYILLRSLRADILTVREESKLSEPDVVCGDFNIPRGSASLELLISGAAEAFATAGTGWGASFPRDWAFLSIDLTFVRAPWRTLRSEIVDFGFGRHRVQVVDLALDQVRPD
jgi:endonuclease/exonuclease/phosphatase family metal-dependent hydrolase